MLFEFQLYLDRMTPLHRKGALLPLRAIVHDKHLCFIPLWSLEDFHSVDTASGSLHKLDCQTINFKQRNHDGDSLNIVDDPAADAV